MAPEQKKRARPVPKSSQGSKKRQKVGETGVASSDVKFMPVSVDALPWNEVAMPDMHDDAEGFFGLEEVEGVEVVKEGNAVKFVTAAKPVYEDDDGFEGFGDDEVVVPPEKSKAIKASKEKKTKKEKTAKRKDVEKIEKPVKTAWSTEETAKFEKAAAKKEKLRLAKLQKETGSLKITVNDVSVEEKTKNAVAAQLEKNKDEELAAKKDELPKNGKPKNQKASNVKSKTDNKASAKPNDNVFALLEQDEETDVSSWQELDLAPDTLSSLSKLGFATPTPIQRAAIPEILNGHDVVGKASTGSGKTLAFGIPIIENWIETYGEVDQDEPKASRSPTALILSPTRELAHQLGLHITALCKGLTNTPNVVVITGGMAEQKQQRQLLYADIIIGTPGRLWELMGASPELTTSFRQIKFLILDEADRILSEGHFKEVGEILGALDRQVDPGEDDEIIPGRQTLVFSATFAEGLRQKLAGKGKRALMDGSESMEYLLKRLNFREDKPKFVDVNSTSQMAEGLKEFMVECKGEEKDLFLYSLLLQHPNQRILVFTNSVHTVRRLKDLLSALTLPVQQLHSHMIQKQRMRAIEKFGNPKHSNSILVATDVAARGLDISGVQVVIHYHLPRAADTYVHRSGRTARANATGTSILICCPDEVGELKRLVSKVHARNAMKAGGNISKFFPRSVDLDRNVVKRLRSRVALGKKIADSTDAKEKKGHDDDWLRKAADDLGAEYDSETFEAEGGQRKGKGSGRRLKEKEARNTSKSQVGAWKAELHSLLSERVNTGISERYLTSGLDGDEIKELLRGSQGIFLGKVDSIGMD